MYVYISVHMFAMESQVCMWLWKFFLLLVNHSVHLEYGLIKIFFVYVLSYFDLISFNFMDAQHMHLHKY